MGFLQLMIINKSGGLIYNQNLSPQAPDLSSNDWLRIGSTSASCIRDETIKNRYRRMW